MEDRRLPGSEGTSDCTGNHAHLATAAHDVCDSLASGVLRTSLAGTVSALGKSLLRSCLGECELPVDGAIRQPFDPLPCEFLSRHGIAYEGGREEISEGTGNLV